MPGSSFTGVDLTLTIVGNGLAVKGGKQILPVGIAIGVAVPICSQDITCAIVGIGVGGIPNGFEKLALVVVGVGNSALSGSGVGGNVTHGIIGIAILLPTAGHRCYLHGGFGAVNIPIGILPGDRAAGDGGQASQTIVAHGQGSAHAGGHGVQAAVGRIVGVPLGVGCTSQLPALTRQLVIGVVVLAGAQDRSAVLLLLAVNQAANGIVGIVILLMAPGFIISSCMDSSRVF